jgi:ABC-type dipeptide/oligopeptide/nickel transport system ATPase component
VEQGRAEAIYANPAEDYTQRLIDAIPRDSIESIKQRVA